MAFLDLPSAGTLKDNVSPALLIIIEFHVESL